MATLAQREQLLKKAAKSTRLQKELYQHCKDDILYWFDHFCWTFNPRGDVIPGETEPRYHLPFNLYPYQRQLVTVLAEAIQTGEPVLIKKSRDMGISWLVCLVFHWFWNFHDGCDFLMGSAKREYVDNKGSRSTLFEKVRYNHQRQPEWLFPKLDREHDNVCKLIHPINGNAIMGEAAVPNFGTSQRYRAILMDELAKQPYSQLAYESATQSTNCIIGVYTPFGKSNMAYRLAQNPNNTHITLTS